MWPGSAGLPGVIGTTYFVCSRKETAMTALKNLAASLIFVVGVGLAGCASEHPSAVGSDAKLQSSGTSKLAFRAPSDGTVYVYNRNTNKLEYQGDVKRDALVEYNPDNKKLVLDDKPIPGVDLVRGDNREIWFSPSHDHTVIHEKTVEHHTSD